jgi:hypothetical protein
MTTCDACGTEWDPRTAAHRRGIDCAAALRAAIDKHEALITRLRVAYQAIIGDAPAKEEAVAKTFEKLGADLRDTRERLENALKRINLLEHPKMEKVPSMASQRKEKP